MVMMPIWLIRETETELICFLGSEPPATAKQERISKSCVVSKESVPCDELTQQERFTTQMPHLIGCLFSVVMLEESKIPADLKKAMYAGSGAK